MRPTGPWSAMGRSACAISIRSSRDHRAVLRDEPLRRQPAADARRLPGLSRPRDSQRDGRSRVDHDALGHAAAAKVAWPPVTNIRTTTSPHWRAWLKPENRCLVPVNSFAEYAPQPNPETKKKDVVWFALNDDRPLTAFAGMWTEFKGDRGTKSKPIPGPHLVYVFSRRRRTRWLSRSIRRPCR